MTRFFQHRSTPWRLKTVTGIGDVPPVEEYEEITAAEALVVWRILSGFRRLHDEALRRDEIVEAWFRNTRSVSLREREEIFSGEKLPTRHLSRVISCFNELTERLIDCGKLSSDEDHHGESG